MTAVILACWEAAGPILAGLGTIVVLFMFMWFVFIAPWR